MCFHCKFTGVPKDLLTPRGVQRRCGKVCFHCNRRLPATAWPGWPRRVLKLRILVWLATSSAGKRGLGMVGHVK